MRTSIFGWAFLATLMTSAAFAADPMAVAPVASTFNWSGGYLGVQGGYGWGDSDHLLGGTNETAHNNADGGVFGGYAGYNYQFSNNMVLGVEGDIAWSGQNGGPDIIVSPAGVPNPPNAVSTDVEWTGALRGRLGYAVDRWLPYVTGGLAFARVKGTYNYVGADGEINEVMTGWTIGAGVDYAFTDNLIFRAEYRYADFGSETQQPFLPGFTNNQEIELTSQDVRIGLAYKF